MKINNKAAITNPSKQMLFDSKFIIILITFFLINGCKTERDIYKTTFKTSYSELLDDFKSPPNDAKIRAYWWWLNSNVTKDCITKDLEAMKNNGYGGAMIFDAGSSAYDVAHKTEAGPAFLSKEWLELFEHAVSEADRLELELSINVQSGWNPGGPSVTPELALKKITWSEMTINGPEAVNRELPLPPGENILEDVKIIAVKQSGDTVPQSDRIKNIKLKTLEQRLGSAGIYPLHLLREDFEGKGNPINKSDIIDITEYFDGENLKWNAPDGTWSVLRFVMINTGKGVSTASDGWEGLAMDHLNKEALLKYNQDVISKLIQTAGKAGNSLKFIHTDSWEMGVANWTDHFMQTFEKRNGYDMTPFLPVLTDRIVINREVSSRFLHDFRRTVADLVAEEFYQTFRDIAHSNKLGTHPESGGPHAAPIDAVQTMKFNDVPMGEFWIRSQTFFTKEDQRLSVKQSASVAHIYGKRFVAAEGPTSIGPHWERPPKDCKNDIDRIFCSGVNRIVWHTYTASPDEYGEPGNEYFAGTHLNRHATWWKESKSFVEYMNRVSSVLSKGLFRADALYYYGDDAPNFIFLKEEVNDLGKGYDWDKCSFDVLMNDVKIKDGMIFLPDGMNYKILVLPNATSIKAELLVKLQELVEDGMILVGPKPGKATGLKNYPMSDKTVKLLADKMWGDIDGKEIVVNNFGKGKVFWGISPEKVLQLQNIPPDFGYESVYPDTHLDYIHRYTPSEDIYFIANRLSRHGIDHNEYHYFTDLPDRYEETVCKFRVSGKVPELWDPITGNVQEIPVYYEKNGYTHVPLHFTPEGSKIIVFRKKKQDRHITKIERNGIEIFPELSLSASTSPNFKFQQEHKKISGQVLHPGTYTLSWSDNETSSFTEKSSYVEKILDNPWELSFNREWAPKQKVVMDSLMFWSDLPDELIKYYSGSAEYSSTFNLNEDNIKGKSICLDLGNVQDIASVSINEKNAGVCWIAPFTVDITPYIKEGNNKIVITVTNSWVNRLIGDSYLSKEERFTQTNIQKFERDNKETFFRKSGLGGTVKLILTKNIALTK